MTRKAETMGLLSFFREMLDGGGTEEDKRMHAELDHVRAMAEAAERGEAMPDGSTLGPKIRMHYHFVGSVQGVGFRFTSTNLANSVGATGWVTNERDGSVTVELQGIKEQIDAVIEGLDRYYNGRRFMGGFTIDRMYDVPVVKDEYEFKPKY